MPESHGILRAEWEVALNEALVGCREVADHHEDAAQRLGEGGASALLLELAASRRSLADALERELRREGALPEAPDADAESVRRVLKWARAALSEDTAEVVLEDRRRAEAALGERLAAAVRPDLAAGSRAVVERAQREVARAIPRLAEAARGAHSRTKPS